jgi:hypothetical protein
MAQNKEQGQCGHRRAVQPAVRRDKVALMKTCMQQGTSMDAGAQASGRAGGHRQVSQRMS